ncbi:NAD(P)-dependent oxidoreductase [Flavobacterium piscis]|uniref:NmrA-like domain-containing protein n=1 Tax=Flavobacterium piscis TaxID=1114874 RepID=A0ABX2XPX4_9FLAO|nr:SDR family oxidoreductase [Flavobacterium piscis]OCB78313.1 hypothetical protein FLP_01010 [Flavobacterium piscis]OXG04235.1 NAD(P)-dependent oxidoreductase [Flavobacterium piscis]
MNNKILITGATGNLGGLIVALLLQKTKAENIAVMLRNDKHAEKYSNMGVDIRIGDYDNQASMTQAFKGVDKLYFISSPDLEARLVQHKNVVEAAKEAKVGHIIYTSFSRKDQSAGHPLFTLAQGHLITEEAIIESAIPYTILLNNYYMEVIPLFAGENILSSKTIYFPALDGKSGFVARKDIAELSVEILVTEGHENKFYEVSGEKAYSFEEVAELISVSSGININYVSPMEEDFKKALKDFGVPDYAIELSVLSAKAIVEGEFEKTSDIFHNIMGKKATSLSEFISEKYGV